MSTLTKHLETLKEEKNILFRKWIELPETFLASPEGKKMNKLYQALTFFIGVGEKLASAGEIEKIIDDKYKNAFGYAVCWFCDKAEIDWDRDCDGEGKHESVGSILAQKILTELTQKGKTKQEGKEEKEEGGGDDRNLQKVRESRRSRFNRRSR